MEGSGSQATLRGSQMATVDEVQKDFDRLFVTQIKERLLNGDGAYLSFIAMLAGVEGLGCFYGGVKRDVNGGIVWKNAELFRGFVADFFPSSYKSVDFWGLRNSLVHRFVPADGFHLTVNDPAIHFKRDQGMVCLDAGCVFEDFKKAASDYFQKVRTDSAIETRFRDVCKEVGILNPTHFVTISASPGTAADSYINRLGLT